MTDVREIIQYIRSLKKGFDKNFFECKINELAFVADNTGLNYEDFHILFKIWLNLSIPITKWTNIGICLVPRDSVRSHTVEYTLRWLLENIQKPNFPRISFVLDWLTAAMDCSSIDLEVLDFGYEIFYDMLTFELLTPHAMKLVYTLTKPHDVTRRRVLHLLNLAKNREGKKTKYNQLQVLLQLFKSYKPECVPENIPAIYIHNYLKKINVTLLERFRNSQENRNVLNKETHQLLWINPLNSVRGRNKKADPLVPNMGFVNIGSTQSKNSQKNYLDFKEPVSLIQYSCQRTMTRPARLRALLCNSTGVVLLSLASRDEHIFLSHDLQLLLTTCFLASSPHSYAEKQDLLKRLAILQRTLMQGIPVVTKFLAQYLPFWNERDYFNEILELCEWICASSPEQARDVSMALARASRHAPSARQIALFVCLTHMYSNLVFSSRRNQHYFITVEPTEAEFSETLTYVACVINDLCSQMLQINPDDLRVLYSSLRSVEAKCVSETTYNVITATRAPILALSLSLLTVSAMAVDKAAAIIIMYRKLMKINKRTNVDEQQFMEQINICKAFTSDLIRCLGSGRALCGQESGLVFRNLHPQIVDMLKNVIPHADAIFSLKNNLAFAPNAPVDYMDIDRVWFDTVIDNEFKNLSEFLKKTVSQLR